MDPGGANVAWDSLGPRHLWLRQYFFCWALNVCLVTPCHHYKVVHECSLERHGRLMYFIRLTDAYAFIHATTVLQAFTRPHIIKYIARLAEQILAMSVVLWGVRGCPVGAGSGWLSSSPSNLPQVLEAVASAASASSAAAGSQGLQSSAGVTTAPPSVLLPQQQQQSELAPPLYLSCNGFVVALVVFCAIDVAAFTVLWANSGSFMRARTLEVGARGLMCGS